jgi:hypothetical protein
MLQRPTMEYSWAKKALRRYVYCERTAMSTLELLHAELRGGRNLQSATATWS